MSTRAISGWQWVKLTFLWVVLALLLMGAAGAGAQQSGAGHIMQAEVDGPNLVVNGGFEQGIDPGRFYVFPTGDTSSLLQGWTLLNAGLDKFHPAVVYVGTYLPCVEGKRCLELANGGENVANVGGIRQTLRTRAGQQYRLTFYQSADIFDKEPRTLRYTVAGHSQAFTYMPGPAEWQNAQKMRWILHSVVFTATATRTTLEFDSVLASPGGKGSLLDDVQVREILPPPSTPSPSTPSPSTPTSSPRTTPTPASTTTLHIAAAVITAGSKQTIQGTAYANGTVAVIVDYADGTQLETSAKVGADSTYNYTWIVPGSAQGTVHVLADSAGSISQATFTIK